MKLDSKKCKERLKSFPVNNEIEGLAIKILLSKPEEVVKIPRMTELTDAQIDELADVIRTIRNMLEIEDES